MQDDFHLLTLCRYVEAKARRAGIVPKAERWTWSGCFARAAGDKPFAMIDWPLERPGNWIELLNLDVQKPELDCLREAVHRGRPFGEENWIKKTARRLGLEFTLRDRGRRKASGDWK